MEYSKYIDHTLLAANATKQEIKKLCEEAKEYHFASVCVNPCWIPYAKELLADSDVDVCVVIGFPLGAMSTNSKVFEAKDAIAAGADEIDVVINIGMLKDRNTEYVTNELRQIKEAIGNHVLKVIIETCLLTEEEKVLACQCVVDSGADFVKTSTGFSTGGATIEDVKLLRQSVGNQAKVKAAGGIRTKEEFLAMIEAGADRIGTSRGIALIK